ncbi:MAG: cytochrome c oxidase subunit II [Thermoleophilaceae bacterium]
MRSRRSTRLLIAPAALGAAMLVLLTLAPGAMADVFTPESGGSPNADDIDSLYKIVLYVSIPIFLVVEGSLIWALIKFRQRRGGPEPEQIRGNHQLELGWTAGATVILVVLAVITFAYLGPLKNPPASDADGLAQGVQVASIDQPAPPKGDGQPLTIGVNGQQYIWRFEYPGRRDAYSYYRMIVPTHTTVLLKITSSDVDHSWWIPKLGGKADAVPGHTNQTWFKIDKEGTYKGQCAELCGEGHADMRAAVKAVSPQRYKAFVARRQREITESQRGLAQQRREREGASQPGHREDN